MISFAGFSIWDGLVRPFNCFNCGLPSPSNEVPNGSNWYLSNNRISGWTYDAAGNLAGIQNMPRTYGYDAENRQTTATVNGVATTYAYDGDGRRVTKLWNGQTTTFVYDAFGNLAAEYGGPVSGSGTQFLTSDHLGSTRLVTDSSGAAVKCYDYLPFGEEIGNGTAGRTSPCFGSGSYPVTGGDATVEFTSKERDAETGLDYFGARYMSAAQGRFTTVDPEFASASLVNPQRWNGYSYATNNPYKFVDPNGESPTLVTAAIGAGIGAVGGAGFNLVSQLIGNGGDFSQVDYRQVGSSALGGAVSGGLAGLTLGVGTAVVGIGEAALVNGAANVVGGAVTRETNDLLGVPQANAPSEATSAAVDFATGFIGGGIGARQANVRYPLPNVRKELDLIANSSRRSLRPGKVAAFSQYASQQQTRNTISGSVIGTSVTNFFSDLFFRVGNVFNPPPVQAKEKITTKICFTDENGKQVCQ